MQKSNKPYSTLELSDKRIIVEWKNSYGLRRTPEHLEELKGLVEKYEAVAHKLSDVEYLGSQWIKAMVLMTNEANNIGKVVALADVPKSIRTTSDLLGNRDSLRIVDTVDEVWKLI